MPDDAKKVLLLCRTGLDSRIWGGFAEGLRAHAEVVTPDPEDPGIRRDPTRGSGIVRTSAWTDDVTASFGRVDVVVGDADGVPAAIDLARRDLAGAVVLLEPRAGAALGVRTTPWWSPEALVEQVSFLRVALPSMKNVFQEKALRSDNWSDGMTPMVEHRYRTHVDPSTMALITEVFRDHRFQSFMPARSSSSVPWVDTIRDLSEPIRVLCAAHDADSVRVATAVAARARHGAVVPLDARTDLPWLEDVDGAVTAVADLL